MILYLKTLKKYFCYNKVHKKKILTKILRFLGYLLNCLHSFPVCRCVYPRMLSHYYQNLQCNTDHCIYISIAQIGSFYCHNFEKHTFRLTTYHNISVFYAFYQWYWLRHIITMSQTTLASCIRTHCENITPFNQIYWLCTRKTSVQNRIW